jgi:hypothetical protein
MNTTANPPRRTNEMSTIATERLGAASDGELPFALEMLKLDSQALRVGRQAGTSVGAPLPLFNGIGGNIELLAPIARWMLDIPGVGHIARAGSLTKLLRAEVLHCEGFPDAWLTTTATGTNSRRPGSARARNRGR